MSIGIYQKKRKRRFSDTRKANKRIQPSLIKNFCIGIVRYTYIAIIMCPSVQHCTMTAKEVPCYEVAALSGEKMNNLLCSPAYLSLLMIRVFHYFIRHFRLNLEFVLGRENSLRRNYFLSTCLRLTSYDDYILKEFCLIFFILSARSKDEVVSCLRTFW